MMLNYDAPLYRPPSEAKSLIFQITLGCSFNECSFCDMYRSKEYSERTWDEVKGEIDMMAKIMPDTERVFFPKRFPELYMKPFEALVAAGAV